MSTLADAQQLHALLQQISKLLDEIDIKLGTAEKDTQKTAESFRKLEQVVLRYLTIAKRLGLPEDMDRSITFISQMIVTARMLHMSLTILEMSHPYTLPLAIAGVILTTLTFQDAVAGYMR